MTHYQNKNSDSLATEKNSRYIVSLAIILALFGLCVFYLSQMNKLVAKNFELRSFEKSLQQSQGKNQALLISLMQRRSLESLQQAAKDLNLVGIEKPNYLKINSHFFALSD